MTWYAAHIVIGMKIVNAEAGPISAYENVVLIEAKTSQEALAYATGVGEAEANLDDGLEVDGMPAKRIFAGVRKLITVSNPESLDLEEDRPSTGTEITYSEFEVENIDALFHLGSGESVIVHYLE